MACGRFLNFEPINKPPWRTRDIRYTCVPTVNKMMTDIVKYLAMWERKKEKSGKNSFAEEKRVMVLEFLFRVQQETMACVRFLSFEPIDEPSWRKRDSKYECVPKVNEMIKNIVIYHDMWLRNKGKADKNSFVEEKRKMVLEFLFRLQKDQGMRRSKKKDTDQSGRWESEELLSLEKTHTKFLDDELVNEQASIERVNEETSLPSSQEVEEYMQGIDNGDENTRIETMNLLRGYRHLKNEWNKLSDEEQFGYFGEIEVETCIQKSHEVLMRNMPITGKTRPGKFSVLPKSTDFEGTEFFYPSYETEEIAFIAVDTIVLEYNKMVKEISEISEIENKHKKLELSLKCATVLLFGFLTIHPFSDGNGRLARLLCSHYLKVFCPFPTSFYNVFSPSNRDDYVRALVNARRDLKIGDDQIKFREDAVKEAQMILEQNPNELCSLVIENNWFTWRQFLRKIGEDIQLFEFEMETLEISAS